MKHLDVGNNLVGLLYYFCFFNPNYSKRLFLKVKYLEKEQLEVLRHLTSLKLDGNHLSVLSDGIFEIQISLEYLGNVLTFIIVVSNSKKQKIYEKTVNFSIFSKDTNFYVFILQTDLSHNGLAKVKKSAFENLSNLTHLDLSYNQLLKLSADSMKPLLNLQALNISGNKDMDLYDIRDTFMVCISF